MIYYLSLIFAFAFLLRCFIRADCDLLLYLSHKIGSDPRSKLKGKVVWITGASRGIGASMAVALANYGVKLVLMARNEQQLDEVKQKCIEAGCCSDDVLILANDLTEQERHKELLQQVLNKFGKVSILVSNAGRSQRAQWNNISMDVDRDLFNLNVFSLISLARVVNRHFKESGEGHHAVMSSTAGKLGAPRSASYTASKHALHGYFECLRMEAAADNINVTMLCPGPVETTLLKDCYTEKLGEPLVVDRLGHRMSSERCATLCVTAITNCLPEVWISEQPVLLFHYVVQYCPILFFLFQKVIGVGTLMKLRDGRDNALPGSKK